MSEKKEDDSKKTNKDRDRKKSDSDRSYKDRSDKRTNIVRDDRDRYKDDKRFRDRGKEKDNREKFGRNRDEKVKEREDKYKDIDKSKSRDRIKISDDKSKKKEESKKDKTIERVSDVKEDKDTKETDVNLNDFVVCDSWSLDNDDKNSPQVEDKGKTIKVTTPNLAKETKNADPMEKLRKSLKQADNPKVTKMEKLKPVIDTFRYEIDPNEDEEEVLDIFDEDLDLHRFSKNKSRKKDSFYESPMKFYYGDKDDLNDDTFLESVINEIKQENESDDESHGLVEYDSPHNEVSVGSVTPDVDNKTKDQTDYSDGCKSADSRKSTESGYKSDKSDKSRLRSGSFRSSIEKEMDDDLQNKMLKSTVDSLETWTFVMKICQPLLFRHDNNKCYR